MPINIHSNPLIHLAEDIRFLAEHARCPRRQRELLLDWSLLVLRCAESAFQEEALFDVVDALVTLSHASAAFSWAAAPPFCRVEPALNVEDQGGYFAGRQAITALIRSAPIHDDLRLRLVNHVLRRIDQDLRHLQALVPLM
jgi:hypothetical protein